MLLKRKYRPFIIPEDARELTDEEMNSVAGGLIFDKMNKEGKLFM